MYLMNDKTPSEVDAVFWNVVEPGLPLPNRILKCRHTRRKIFLPLRIVDKVPGDGNPAQGGG